MGRKRMAQTVDAALIGQPSSPDGVPENFGGRAVQDGLLRVAAGWKKPNRRTADGPVAAQLLQQSGREQRVAILAPFALLDPNLHPRAVNMRRLEVTSLVEPQSRSVNGHQESPMFRMRTAYRQQLLQFLHGINLRAAHRLFYPRHRQPQLFWRPLECQLIERT